MIFNYGKGKIFIEKKDPKELVLSADADSGFMRNVKRAYEKEAMQESLKQKIIFTWSVGRMILLCNGRKYK